MVQDSHHADVRYRRLLDTLRPLERVIVAYSGGVDSTLVVKAAADALGTERVLAVTGVSASLAPREREACGRVLTGLGLAHRHRLLETREQENPAYRRNNPDRCFHCKSELYTQLAALARREGYAYIANGANLDDRDDFRPGMEAATDFGVRSPLLEAGLNKADVRALAALLSLPNRDKAASPCLASRVPHGQEVTGEKLAQIARAEAYLEDLGLTAFRVRHHGDLARIEAPESAWPFFDSTERRRQIEQAFVNFGFRFVALDLGGYRQGKAVIL